ncbi:MAG TPA: hypothetical protein VNA30_01430 [Mycobacteriales bacterium]|nr:hypothetical protein [Mycobacteriales bacterium]
MAFWWCLRHNAVEGTADDDSGCANDTRLGPYDDAALAAQALELTRARTQAEDERDEAEDDGPG